MTSFDDAAEASAYRDLLEARPLEEWHEDMGPKLWWKFPVTEAPYCGSPLDLGRELVVEMPTVGHCFVHIHGDASPNAIPRTKVTNPGKAILIGGWPGYHTHFTDIVIPKAPQ